MQTPTLSLATRSPDLEDLIEKARGYIHAANRDPVGACFQIELPVQAS